MNWFGPVASHAAERTDLVFLVLLVFSAGIVILVAGLVARFGVRYRRGSSAPRAELPRLISREIELGWTAAIGFSALFLFWYAAAANFSQLVVDPNALEVHIDAKQWMWKAQHPTGAREINALHAPVGQPVRLIMASADVIHSFYVPALRLKQDVVPGQLTTLGFVIDKAGVYPLRCAEFCGTNHSRMLGQVIAVSADEYGAWLSQQPTGGDLALEGKALFAAFGCASCHAPGAKVRAPPLEGLFGKQILLADGRRVSADEGYIRRAILFPRREVRAGYRPIMPSLAGRATDEQVAKLVDYIKSLANAEPAR